jgi:PIN domain nuclease of toxin-antitoxin system
VRLLLDTHLLLWVISQSRRLSSQARDLIGDLDNELWFSVASLWEVAIKQGQVRDDFRVDPRLLRRNLLNNGYNELAVAGEHAVATRELPRLHKDPFDRMLVAQSVVEEITLLTTDPLVAQYPAPVRRV